MAKGKAVPAAGLAADGGVLVFKCPRRALHVFFLKWTEEEVTKHECRLLL